MTSTVCIEDDSLTKEMDAGPACWVHLAPSARYFTKVPGLGQGEVRGGYSFMLNMDKRVFNLLGGVNQGCSHLLARGLEKGQPGVLVNTRRRLNTLLGWKYRVAEAKVLG